MTSNLSHCFQCFRIQLERLSYLRVISQNNSQFLIQSVFDIGRNVDLVDTKLSSLTDLFIRVTRTTVQYQRNVNNFLDLFQKFKFQLRFESLRIQTMSGSDCNCKTVAVGLLYELNSLFRFGVDDVGSATCNFWYRWSVLPIVPSSASTDTPSG